MSRFVHLHAHSAFSLAEGAVHIDQLKDLCVQMNMPALAVSDSNNLFGALEASEKLSAANIQPIPALQLSLSPASLGAEAGRKAGSGKAGPGPAGSSMHADMRQMPSVVLLAQNEAGYQNLMALSSKAFVAPESADEPCVSFATLASHDAGLICLTGGWAGPIDQLLHHQQKEAARALLARFCETFDQRLYVEIQRYDTDANKNGRALYENDLLRLAYAADLPIVATNTVFFPGRADYEAHDALLCIAAGSYIHQEDRRKVTPAHYFKSPAEMTALFADLPEALEATIEIAQRCAFRPRLHAPILPNFTDQGTESEMLAREARAGLAARLAGGSMFAARAAYFDRLDFELGVIEKMGFPGYFLIVADFIKWAKRQDIPVGPGRGSGAGSVVAWALTITDLDPLQFNLLFERFLNPERVSMPDFDIDFCQDRRDEVIAYVQEKYGADRVAQIITFGKLQARAVLRDVGRVLNMPFGQVDRLCKLVPNNPANPVSLGEAIKSEPRLQEEREADERVAALLTMALKLEGLYRHASTHAAGVVIADRPLERLVPLYLDPRSDMPATQFNMKWVEPAGLVKFDFLGLKTLTVIQRALDLIAKKGESVDINTIPLDDMKTYKMLGEGASIGVFQLESAGMRATLKSMKPDSLEDIIALVSLYRPGPMDNIPTYIDRKLGNEQPDYFHPMLQDILKETYGVIIYQEQVMQIAQTLSGYSLGEADLLRRAMGKKKKEEMDQQKKRFIEGACKNDVPARKAEEIFDMVAKFAGYGFNKSHAAAYALIAYQTAWLKANHLPEFLAASMSLDRTNTDKLGVFLNEAKMLDVTVRPPDVNQSEVDFTVRDGEILYALSAIKNVGTQAMQHIVTSRERHGPFTDIYDFAEAVNGRELGKRGFESLIRAGAMDVLDRNRRKLLANTDYLIRYSAQIADEAASSQGGLFGDGMGVRLDRPPLREQTPFSSLERLAQECEAIGFYFTGHPLDEYSEKLEKLNVLSVGEITKMRMDTQETDRQQGAERQIVMMAGVIREVTRRISAKSGKPFAWVALSDQTGDFEVMVFSDVLAKSAECLQPGAIILATVSLDMREGDIRYLCDAVQSLTAAANRDVRGVDITINAPMAVAVVKAVLEDLGSRSSPGAAPGSGPGGGPGGSALGQVRFLLPIHAGEIGNGEPISNAQLSAQTARSCDGRQSGGRSVLYQVALTIPARTGLSIDMKSALAAIDGVERVEFH